MVGTPLQELAELDLSGLAGTFLGDLDPEARAAVLSGATVLEVSRGGLVFGGQSASPRLAVLLQGTVRVNLLGSRGRRITARYLHAGSLVASTTGWTDGLPLLPEAVGDCLLAELEVRSVTGDPRLDRALFAETTRRLQDVYRVLAATAFGSLTERIAFHVLELAEPSPGGGLTATVTQQGLADGLGTVREAVARGLRSLKSRHLVATRPGAIDIVDIDGLVEAAGSWWTSSRLLSTGLVSADRRAFDDLDHAVVGIDRQGTIVYANARAARTFRWDAQDLVGQPVERLLPGQLGGTLSEFMADVRPGPIGLGRTLHGRRADGSLFPAEVTLLPVHSAPRMVVLAIVVDVTYRAVLREALSRR